MEELKAILIAHAKRYPLMQPTDAVKLIYQNEFGGGHLIRDEQACLTYLQREYDSIEKNRDLPIGEDIGNGILRVNLAALKPEDLERLGAVFLRSAAEHTGDPARFLEKLDVLRTLTREGVFAFGTQELESYLEDYGRAGYPPVSHSDFYREKYKPAYRIVLEKYWKNRM
jgi:hypothetical protein